MRKTQRRVCTATKRQFREKKGDDDREHKDDG